MTWPINIKDFFYFTECFFLSVLRTSLKDKNRHMDLNMDRCSHILKFSLMMIVEYPGFGLFHCVASLMSCLTATFGNSIIICAFRKASSMNPASRILLLSVAASDLGVGLFVQPTNTAIMVKLLVFKNIHGDVAKVSCSVSSCEISANSDYISSSRRGNGYLDNSISDSHATDIDSF